MKNRTSSAKIIKLKKNEVFVFGSNAHGAHDGGAAKLAHEKFGAIHGQSEGLQGKSYGIDTMSGINVLKKQVERFIDYARNYPESLFLVTEIGCGIAGYKPEEIAPLFADAISVENIHLPESFWPLIKKELTMEQPTKKVLVLKSVKPDMTAYGGFKYPEKGFVEAVDFNHKKECGGGLHGWLWGVGDFSLMQKEFGSKWIVLEVIESKIISLDEKVKFPSGEIIFCGTFKEAFQIVRREWWSREKINPKKGISSTTGDSAHSSTTGNSAHSSTTGNSAHSSTTGDYAHSSTTGYYAHSSTTGNSAHSSTTGNSAHSSTTGDYAHSSTTGYSAHSSTTGDSAHSSTTGDSAHSSTTGDSAHSSTTGYSAHSSTTGDSAHSSTTGDSAHSSTTGDSAHSSTTGDYAKTSATGKNSIACALGKDSRARVGANGSLILTYWNGNRFRHVIGYEGENGIEANTWYELNGKREIIKSTNQD